MSVWILRILIGVVILFLVEFYFTKRTTWLIKNTFSKVNERKLNLWNRIFLIILNLYPAVLIFSYLYRLITDGRISPPDTSLFDYILVYPFWILFLIMFQTSIYFAVIDILRLVVYPFIRRRKENVNSFVAKLMFAILVFFTLYVPIRIIYDYYTVSIRKVEYSKEHLPNELNGFRITFISDIQADRYTDESRLQNFIDKVNSTKSDLVLIAGDFITSTPEYIQESADYVAKIKSKYGIYACVGDHDNWAYRDDYVRSLREVSEALTKKGIKFINNSKREILVDSSKICITFITNTYVEQVDKNILDSLTRNDNDCDLKIFLVHQPREFLVDKAIERNYDLFLAGHTHGGQITLLFPFVYITPTMFETKYIRGDFWFRNTLMIVTRGLGMSLAPIRYNSTPEVTLIILQNSK
jgi:predicted MPP superfamily phosphohydrolase